MSRRQAAPPLPPGVEAQGVENKLPKAVPEGACCATERSRSPVAASLSPLVPLDLVCVRALPAGEPAEGRAFHARYVEYPVSFIRTGTRDKCCVRTLLGHEHIVSG
jgi:hypothetical protein